MSGEDEETIQKKFVDELGAKYPLVKIDSKDKQPYGIQGYPTAYLIDPEGLVVSVGHGMPSDDQIEALLGRVSFAPKLPEETRYEPLRALWNKREYAKVRDYLDKNLAAPNLDAEMKEVMTAQRAELDKRQQAALARIGSLGQGPDYAAAVDQLQTIGKQWKGMEPATAAANEQKRFAADPTIKKELAAGKALQKLMASFDPSKQSQRKKLVTELEKFRKKHEGLHAAKLAEDRLAGLAGG